MNTQEKLESIIGSVIAVHDALVTGIPNLKHGTKLSRKQMAQMVNLQTKVIHASATVLLETLTKDCPDEFMKVKADIERETGVEETKH